jgi:hypothetical protein
LIPAASCISEKWQKRVMMKQETVKIENACYWSACDILHNIKIKFMREIAMDCRGIDLKPLEQGFQSSCHFTQHENEGKNCSL